MSRGTFSGPVRARTRCPMVDTRGGASPAGRPRLGPERRSHETITSRVDRGSWRGLALDVVGVEWMQRDGEAVASGRDDSVEGSSPGPSSMPTSVLSHRGGHAEVEGIRLWPVRQPATPDPALATDARLAPADTCDPIKGHRLAVCQRINLPIAGHCAPDG